MWRLKTVLPIIAAALLFAASEAAAQPPGAATGLAAREGKSVGFRWPAVSGASWYYLWINDASGTTRQHRWYEAAELDCGTGQSLVCKTGVTLDAVPGRMTWWVQTYGAGGYGPWSAGQTFTPGPLAAVIAADGTRVRGNATASTLLGVGLYEVLFDRDITTCVYNINLGGTTTDSQHGFVSVTRRAGNAMGVFVYTKDTAGTDTNKPFHLSVVCGATQ